VKEHPLWPLANRLDLHLRAIRHSTNLDNAIAFASAAEWTLAEIRGVLTAEREQRGSSDADAVAATQGAGAVVDRADQSRLPHTQREGAAHSDASPGGPVGQALSLRGWCRRMRWHWYRLWLDPAHPSACVSEPPNWWT
jgi:hypothetical protein